MIAFKSTASGLRSFNSASNVVFWIGGRRERDRADSAGEVQVAGETMDAFPVDGLLQPAMLVKLTDSKAPIIQKEIEKARKKRKG